MIRLRDLVGREGDESGAVLPEVALVFLMYMLLVVFIIQVAVWAFTISATQFAVWEGCRRGAGAYQPPPPDGTGSGSLISQLETGMSEEAYGASFAAIDRIEEILNWLPLTQNYSDLTAAVVEEEVMPGEEGERDITASAKVTALMVLPLVESWLGEGWEGFVIERSCRLRLARYYSY